MLFIRFFFWYFKPIKSKCFNKLKIAVTIMLSANKFYFTDLTLHYFLFIFASLT